MVVVAGYPGNYSNYQQNFYNSVNQGLQKVLGSQVLHIYSILYLYTVYGSAVMTEEYLYFSLSQSSCARTLYTLDSHCPLSMPEFVNV